MEEKRSPWGLLVILVCLGLSFLSLASFVFKFVMAYPLNLNFFELIREVIKQGFKLSEQVRAYPQDIVLYQINYGNSIYAQKLGLAWKFSGFIHFLILLLILKLMEVKRSLYGDARFATVREVEKANLFISQKVVKPNNGLFAGDKIIVGKFNNRYVGLGGQLFAYLAAPTRSGKGVGVVIPVGLSYEHSMVVSDIKQELFEITGAYRKQCGHKVFLFDPFNPKGKTHRWNPLTYVKRTEEERVDDLNQIAICLIPDTGGDDSFFEESARKLFIGLGLWCLDIEAYNKNINERVKKAMAEDDERADKKEAKKAEEIETTSADGDEDGDESADGRDTPAPDASAENTGAGNTGDKGDDKDNKEEKERYEPSPTFVPTIRAILDFATDFKGEAISHFSDIMNQSHIISKEAKQSINSAVSAGDKTFASILATLTANLTPWLSKPVSDATGGDDFDLREIRKQKMTIYLGIQPKDLAKASKIINLFYSQLINENTSQLPQIDKKLGYDPKLPYQCLMLMDEGTAAGRIAILEKAVSYMAGYNMRLLFIAQSPAQLEDRKVYGEHGSRNILTNIALKVLYKPNDVADSEQYSKLLGKITVKEDTSKSRGGGNKGVSRTESLQQRDLMMPQELRAMSKDKEIIIFEGINHPIAGDKNKYYEDPIFKARYLNRSVLPIQSIDERIANDPKLRKQKEDQQMQEEVDRITEECFEAFARDLENGVRKESEKNGLLSESWEKWVLGEVDKILEEPPESEPIINQSA